jgi:addiction module RelE/StbE family toxin
MKLDWSLEAQRNLRSIRSYVELRNPSAAKRVADEIVRAALRLETFPKLGRAAHRSNLRLLQVPNLPYLIPYRIDGDQIEIIAVFDERQDRPPEWM